MHQVTDGNHAPSHQNTYGKLEKADLNLSKAFEKFMCLLRGCKAMENVSMYVSGK